MAKRELYKPAPSTLEANIQNSPHSKSLAQGVLSTKNSSWQEELNKSIISQDTSHQKSTDLRRSLLSTIEREVDFRTPEKRISLERLERKSQLKAKSSRTPDVAAQQDRLDDQSSKARTIFKLKNEVVVVDASGPVLNPQLREVSTTSHTVFSPAKVVCHSPSPGKSPRTEGQGMEENVTVKIKSPKEIIFGDENTSKNDSGEIHSQTSPSKDSSSQIGQDKVSQIKKKKKAPRIVQSRYKNPKEQKPRLDSTTKPSRPLTQSFFNDISAIAANQSAQGQVKGQAGRTKKAKVTSTPFNPAQWSEKTCYIPDGSYLDASRSMTFGKHDVIQENNKKHKATKDKDSVTAAPVRGKTPKRADSGISTASEVSDWQLEMQYCRMLQAMHLHAKARNTFAKQEKSAKDQIYKVWQENQKVKADVRNLKKAIRAKKHAMMLDQLLKAQDSGLCSVEESLHEFHNNYLTMGEVLDSTRHYLPVEGVKIQSEEKLISALKESQMLLAQITSYTGGGKTDVSKLSKDMNLLVEKLSSQITEQDNCQELLLAINSLTNQERSLQAQILQ